MKQFCWPVRVYYEDTDSGGVVYYANYLKFMERARTEWLRELGYEQDVLLQEYSLVFVVRSVQIDYLQPARFNDALTVTVQVAELGGASIKLEQLIRRANTHEALCQAVVKIVCVNTTSFKPVAIPQKLKTKIQ